VVRHKLVQEIVEAYRLFNEARVPQSELDLDQTAGNP
jgi:hypothetical protein